LGGKGGLEGGRAKQKGSHHTVKKGAQVRNKEWVVNRRCLGPSEENGRVGNAGIRRGKGVTQRNVVSIGIGTLEYRELGPGGAGKMWDSHSKTTRGKRGRDGILLARSNWRFAENATA